MLRALLLGVLTLTAVSCKSHGGSQASQASVAAGKVLEVTGSVTLHHGTETRPLAKGDMIDADDEVETGADGSAVIEVQHNNVNWELGPGKKGKLRESLAWTQPKKDKSAKAVDEDSAAAGRHAERSAAESSVTAEAPRAEAEMARADEDRGEAPVGAAAPAPGAPAAQPVAPPTSDKKAAPPPPPPPPKPAPTAPAKATSRERAIESTKSATIMAPQGAAQGDMGLGVTATGEGGGGGGGGGGTSKGAMARSTSDASGLVHGKDADLKKCLAGTAVDITVKVDATGKATIVFKGTVDAKVQTCVKDVVKTITFDKQAATISYSIKP